jgi:5-(carboxyamino)imidazole ribonucleotide mutase
LLAASIVANKHEEYCQALLAYRAKQTQSVLDHPDPREENA